MRMVEMSGGIFTMVPSIEYKFLEHLVKKNITSFSADTLTERNCLIADSLVRYNILDKDENHYYVKEVHL